MKKTLIASAVLAASVFSASAMANASEYYLWGDAGTSYTTEYDKAFDNADRDQDASMYGMGLGVTFGQDMFAEFGYQSLGTSEFSGSEIQTSGGNDYLVTGDGMENKHEAFVVRLGKTFEWNPLVAFSVHLGGAHADSETSGTVSTEDLSTGVVVTEEVSESETNVIGMAGVGMNFTITDNLDARVRFERMMSVESSYDEYHLDNLTAGVTYRF